MSALQIRAEIERLARLLGVSHTRLEALAAVDAAALKTLRQQATAMLYDADREYLQRVAAATKLVPSAITALIAEKSLGPLLCARIAGLLPTDTALDIAKRLPDDFLADLCIELDPRRARPVVEAIPVPRAVAISLELARRREYVVMGRFVDILGIEALAQTMARLADDAVLLRVAFYAEDRPRLNRVIEKLPEARFGGIIDAALADGGELWPEALALIAALESRWRHKFAMHALQRDDDSIAHIVRTTDAGNLWTALLPVIEALDDEATLQRLRDVLLAQDAALIGRIRAAAPQSELLARLAA